MKISFRSWISKNSAEPNSHANFPNSCESGDCVVEELLLTTFMEGASL